MSQLLENLHKIDKTAIAIESSNGALSYGTLLSKIAALALWLKQQNVKSLSVYAQNSEDWIVIDFACQQADVIFTPIPLFFTQIQFEQLVNSVKPAIIFSDRSLAYSLGNTGHGLSLSCYQLENKQLAHSKHISAPIGTTKITYTSGSTGHPKGVCLSIDNQFKVANSLVEVIGLKNPRHLCLLPLPTLLENIAGVYSPFIAGGTVIIANDSERGFDGSRLVNPQQLLASISQAQPNSLILVPELLQVLMHAISQGWKAPTSLKFIAVGGSKVSPSLIHKARLLNLPVYQGYGLSECSSVVSLCTPNCDSVESAGALLPHLQATVENDEIVVTGNTFLGYLEDQSSWYKTRIHTGDIAQIKDNFIYVTGRLKNIIINSFGRNISPEWVESEILTTGLFQQAVLIGDARPFCIAILVPISSDISSQVIDSALVAINANLPDYAKVKGYIPFQKKMSLDDGLYTSNGRPKRDAIVKKFQTDIECQYHNMISDKE